MSPRTIAPLLLTASAALLAGCGGGSPAGGAPADGRQPGQPDAERPIDPPIEVPSPPMDPGPIDPPSEEPADPTDPGDPTEPGDPTDPEDPTDPPAEASVPADLLDLTSWKLTLPEDTPHAGSPDEIRQPELATFAREPFFMLNEARDGVVFRAPVEGATTSGSG